MSTPHNAATLSATVVADLSPVPQLTTRGAFRLAWPTIRQGFEETPCDYLLAVVSERSYRTTLLPIHIDREQGAWPVDVVLGRHAQCDMVLDDDPGVSLRHVIARFYHQDGALRVRFLDLQSRTGLIDENGHPRSSLISTRHLFVRFARHHLFAVRHDGRIWRMDPDEAWAALPARELIEAAPVEMTPRREPSIRPQLHLEDNPGETTFITSVSGSSFLQTQRPSRAGTVGTITFEGRAIDVSPEQLAGGVLIGRYERCLIETLHGEDNDAISRVHVCLLLDETGLWLIDTASTNGTWVQGESVRTYPLRRYTPFRLASGFQISWQRR